MPIVTQNFVQHFLDWIANDHLKSRYNVFGKISIILFYAEILNGHCVCTTDCI